MRSEEGNARANSFNSDASAMKRMLYSIKSTDKILATIKRRWLEEKLRSLKAHGYFYEYKEFKPHWTKRLNRVSLPCEIVFLCGREVFRVS